MCPDILFFIPIQCYNLEQFDITRCKQSYKDATPSEMVLREIADLKMAIEGNPIGVFHIAGNNSVSDQRPHRAPLDKPLNPL